MINIHSCIGCNSIFLEELGTLGKLPNCNFFTKDKDEAINLPKYELNLVKCNNCELVQIGTHIPPGEIFNIEYPYFSSCSSSWLEYMRVAAEKYKKEFKIDSDSSILEIGSNDGYLLKNFDGCKVVVGVEPTAGPAEESRKLGIHTIQEFFSYDVGVKLLSEVGEFDLIFSKNMLAHTPDLIGILKGVRLLLKETGVFIVEVQYAFEMFQSGKFDTIYHEHYCYYTLHSINNILEKQSMCLFDAEILETHGGSLRLYISKNKTIKSDNLKKLMHHELEILENNKNVYQNIFTMASNTKQAINLFIEENGPLVAYGAPTKGNVFMNYCGLNSESISFTADRSKLKQGRYCPGSGVPVLKPEASIYNNSPNVLLLAWNIENEIKDQFSQWENQNSSILVAIPKLRW